MKLGHMLFKTTLFMKYNKLFLVVLLIVEIIRGFILKVVHIFLWVPCFCSNHDLVHVCTRTLYKWYFKRGYQRKKRKGCYFKDYKKVDWVILHVYAYNEFNFFLTWNQIVKNNLNAPLFPERNHYLRNCINRTNIITNIVIWTSLRLKVLRINSW